MSEKMLFLGAGASYQFDKPTTPALKKDLIKAGPTVSPILRSILKTPGFGDIEHVLAALHGIRDLLSNPEDYLTQYLLKGKIQPEEHTLNDFDESFQYLKQNIEGTEKSLINTIFETYDWKSQHDPELRRFYEPLLDLLTEDSNKVYIGTTNYDQAVERFCTLGGHDYRCIDGFDEANSGKWIWKKENFNVEPSNGKKFVYLYKIHGSLKWTRMGGQIIKLDQVERFRGYENDVFIAPTVNPKVEAEKEPFTTLNNEFTKKSEAADAVIIIGCSFRDQHINEIFQKFIDDERQVIIISPSADKTYAKNFANKNLSEDKLRQWASNNVPNNVHFITKYLGPKTNQDVLEEIKKLI